MIPPSLAWWSRPTLLTGLGVLVGLSVIARPSSLITFALIALAGQMRGGRRRD